MRKKCALVYIVIVTLLSAGLYPEIPECSELDFSALKEEVPLYIDPLLCSVL